ncbi:MAG: 30S ribosomal protein S2 [Acidimicrobiia bacterium]|nr:30S ribosomal protein S2 [Acidimicrobiia bacterium]
MAVISMRELLEAGVHFGHQTRRWNPKMKRFIHGDRNGIYIIDLEQTLSRIEVAYSFVRDMVGGGGSLLFVGTKKQAKDGVRSYAERCNMPYVNERWLGGMLTNFQTMHKRVAKMKEYQHMRDSGDFELMPKKEALLISRELAKLEKNLSGIRDLERLPEAIFVIDTKIEAIAVTEANKLGIPIVAVVDTNCDPDSVQYVIPGNDDAIRAGSLMCRIMSDAVQEGRFIRSRRGGDSGGPAVRSDEEQARIDAMQAQARMEAAAQAAEREARIAAGRTNPEAPGAPAPAEPAAAEVAAPAAAEPAPAPEAPAADA